MASTQVHGLSNTGASYQGLPSMQRSSQPAVRIFVPKPRPPPPHMAENRNRPPAPALVPEPPTAPATESTIRQARDDEGVLTAAAPPLMLMINAAVWNVRGLNRRHHQNVARVQNCVPHSWKWFVDYMGPGNRIWLTWKHDEVDVTVISVYSQMIHCSVLIRHLHIYVLVSVIYGANDGVERRQLWDSQVQLADSIDDEPWLVIGDFNMVADMSEVCGHSGDILVAMEEFQDCISQTGLITLPMQGDLFTWHNHSTDSRSLWKRLDRMLANDRWLARWPDVSYSSLNARTSDHSPLVIDVHRSPV
ncbi:UNVERIFIED_CONTAM: hypothetical protein Slati_0886100 [Sesamum latifolium]|uniref:Endonuclease/exonuclease/phosphatase domain-containing protein n=1 Tax=Sesamum latifolium TaxID=2727402 RepID=A0AAW2XNJ1_9LAMI